MKGNRRKGEKRVHEESLNSPLKAGREEQEEINFRAWLIITSQTIKLTHIIDEEIKGGTSLVFQWLRLCAPNGGRLSSIPGQGTRSHELQLRCHGVK